MAEKTVFVKIDEHKDVHEVVEAVKSKIMEAKESLDTINKIKREEEAELDSWRSELEDVAKKVVFIDETLYGQGE